MERHVAWASRGGAAGLGVSRWCGLAGFVASVGKELGQARRAGSAGSGLASRVGLAGRGLVRRCGLGWPVSVCRAGAGRLG